MGSISAYWRLFRPLTALSTISAAVGGAFYAGIPSGYEIFIFLLTLFGVAMAHFSINALNDYLDYKSGLDLKTSRTPFSGGSKVIVDGLLSPRQALGASLATLSLAFLAGVVIAAYRGPLVLLFAAAGAAIIGTYNVLWLKIYLGEASVVAKGALVFLGSLYAVHGELLLSALPVGLLYGLLSAMVLLVNEVPDVEADKSVGRRTLPCALGDRTHLGYIALASLYAAIAVYAVTSRLLSPLVLLSLLPLLASLRVASELRAGGDLIHVMRENSAICRACDAVLTLSIIARALLQQASL